MNEPRSRTVALVVALAAFAGYAPTFGHDWLADWDDTQYVLDSPIIAKGDWDSVRHVCDPRADRSRLGDEYLPVRDLVSIALYKAFGTHAVGHRVALALLHAAASVLAYALLRELGLGAWYRAAAALCYAVHPVHVESVAWVSSLKDVLAGTLFFASLALFARSRRLGSRVALAVAVALYPLAALSKSTAIVLPAIALAIEVFFPRRAARAWVAHVALGAAFAVLVAIAVGVGHRHGVVKEILGGTREVAIPTATWVLLRYLGLCLLPVVQQIPYPYAYESPYRWVVGWGAPRFLVAAGVLVPLALFAAGRAVAAWRRRRAGAALEPGPVNLAAFAVAWFFAGIAPVSNLVIPIPEILAERYLYLASFAGCLLVALPLELARRPGVSRRARVLALVLVASLLGFHGVRLLIRGADWCDSRTLWEATLDADPANAKARFKLAYLFTEGVRRGMYAPRPGESATSLRRAAIAHLADAVELDPAYASAHNNLAWLLFEDGRPGPAARHALRAFDLHPEVADFGDSLAAITDAAAARLAAAGDLPAARALLESGLARLPGNARLVRRVAAIGER